MTLKELITQTGHVLTKEQEEELRKIAAAQAKKKKS